MPAREMNVDPRYQRQARLPQIGEAGQTALQQARVVLVGLGALGSVSADLLTRAGVGHLVLLDRDVVEWSNLQRQILYDEEDADQARPKAVAAVRRLKAVNRQVQLEAHAVDLSAENAPSLLQGADLILDGTDNFATRYLLNDYAVVHGLPYVYAGVVGTYGMVGALLPNGPCLRCTFPEPPEAGQSPTCRTAGVLGPAVSVMAALATAEAMKWLVGQTDAVVAGFRYVDLWSGDHRLLRSRQDPDCPCCGQGQHPWLEGRRGARGAEILCAGNAVQIPAAGDMPSLATIAARLQGTVQGLQQSRHHLRFQEGDLELFLFADGRALVRGTEDPGRARALLARTIGA
ncbi:MAG: thiazole biosynthesis adenylyltransferase ThiF [Planctomycetota bacterium]|nr:MAG: thiazole biosynthesis adenylyltransferase ThiF [Planctomycetota bacterium]